MEAVLALRESFDELVASTVYGVSGVWAVHSGKPGPVVGITVMTHGNEPSGLAVYRYFRHEYGLEGKLRFGSVYFVLNNIEATKRYFEAVAANADAETKRKTRFVKLNMNRLPEDPFSGSDGGEYEVIRARELQIIWNRFDHALDIHSMSQDSAPMIVALARSDIEVASRFPIVKIISNIDAIQTGKPATYFYGNTKASVYGIEAGQHEHGESFGLAIVCTQSFLSLLGSLPESKVPERVDQEEYRVFGKVWFDDESYELTRAIPNFGQIRKGETLATGNGDPIIAEEDCYGLMAPPGSKPTSIKEEVLFLAHRLDHPAR